MYSQWHWAHACCHAPIPTLVSRTLLSFSWEPLSPLNTASLSTPPSCPWWPLSYSLSLWIWLSGALTMWNHPAFILCDRLIPRSIVSSRLIPGVACVRVVPVSLRSSSIPPCVYIASCLCVHWPMGTWVASTVWLFVNNAAVNLFVQVFVWISAFTSFEYTPRGGFSVLYSNSILFLSNLNTVFYRAVPFYIPTSSAQGFQSLHILNNSCFLLFFL